MVFFLLVTAIGSFIYTHIVISKIRENERSTVELWARAMEYNSQEHYAETRRELNRMHSEIHSESILPSSVTQRWLNTIERAQTDLESSAIDFVNSELIIKNRFEIPSMLVSEQGEILYARNTGRRQANKNLIARYASINEPIRIDIGSPGMMQRQFVYYGDSGIIRALQYYPYVQFGLLALFLGVGYISLSSLKRTEQSNLWVGMAREAAHQLGTPLSSLYGWITLLKEQNNDQETLNIAHEIANDLDRMQTVADRFNKIGSIPELKPKKAAHIIRQVTDYLEKRLPRIGKHVELSLQLDSDRRISMNTELFAWALENLLKNSLDAIEKSTPNARVHLHAYEQGDYYVLDISDNGKGIEKRYHKEIFNPGFSTKKRGWGLGLSLTRRIVEEYHNGKVYVWRSAPGEGTTFRMMFPIIPEKPSPNGVIKEMERVENA